MAISLALGRVGVFESQQASVLPWMDDLQVNGPPADSLEQPAEQAMLGLAQGFALGKSVAEEGATDDAILEWEIDSVGRLSVLEVIFRVEGPIYAHSPHLVPNRRQGGGQVMGAVAHVASQSDRLAGGEAGRLGAHAGHRFQSIGQGAKEHHQPLGALL